MRRLRQLLVVVLLAVLLVACGGGEPRPTPEAATWDVSSWNRAVWGQ